MEIALMDEEALIRRAAVENIFVPEADKLAKLIAPVLYDPVKTVRIEAANRLAGEMSRYLDEEHKTVYGDVLEEYIRAMEYTADFAASRHNLAILETALGKPGEAIKQYQQAIRIDDHFYPAKVNLSVLYNQRGENDKAERLLREVVADQPELYDAAYSLGLLLVEMQNYTEGAAYLEQASRGLPTRARIHYNLGLLYAQMQNGVAAEGKLRAALDLEPQNLEFQYGLADFYLKRGMFEQARPIAEAMASMHPDNPIGAQMLDFIRMNTGQ